MLFRSELAPQPHARALGRVFRHQRRFGKCLVEVLADQRRFDDRHAVVHERRHHALRIELEVGRIVLLGLEQVDAARLPGEALFDQGDADLLAADRVAEVVEDQHRAVTRA